MKLTFDKLGECFITIKARAISFENLTKNVGDFITYFEKTWINGVEWMRPEVWNYYNYIGRRTNNDLESFNKQANSCIREKTKY